MWAEERIPVLINVRDGSRDAGVGFVYVCERKKTGLCLTFEGCNADGMPSNSDVLFGRAFDLSILKNNHSEMSLEVPHVDYDKCLKCLKANGIERKQ